MSNANESFRESNVGLEDELEFSSSLLPDESGDRDTTGTPEMIATAAPGTEGPWVGKRLRQYKLIRSLGAGAMGRVFLALDVNIERMVALKVLRRRIRSAVERHVADAFLQEARSAASIDHPSVVRVYEISEFEGWWYIAMEYVDGQTIEQMVNTAGPLPVDRACILLADAANALSMTHDLGLIHRDVKPTNVLVSRRGIGKLVDFGLAQPVSAVDPFERPTRAIGTPKYMAPEIIRHEHPGPAADIYSLGGTLWFALTGKPPYAGDTVTEVLGQHLRAEVPDPKKSIPNCSRTMDGLLQRMLAKEPEKRPSAIEVLSVLRSEAIGAHTDDSGTFVSGSWLASGVESRNRNRRRKQWALAVVIVLILGGLTGIGFLTAQHLKGLRTLSDRFAGAPVSYGRSDTGTSPSSFQDSAGTPPFSWIGKVDPADFQFVASRRGERAWPIDHPDARFIRAEDFIGYRTEREAVLDGRMIVR